jgi:DNA-binding protein H-NS
MFTLSTLRFPNAIDLNSMSKAEFLKLQKDAERAMKSLEDRRRSEAKVKELGFSIAKLFDGKSKAKSAGAPKYRHPKARP